MADDRDEQAGGRLNFTVLVRKPRGGIYHVAEEGWYQTLQNIVTCDKAMSEEDRVTGVNSQTILRSGGNYLGNYSQLWWHHCKLTKGHKLVV